MNKPEKWILTGIPALFLLGGLWHFIYDFLPFTIIAAFAPVNDSVWEHMKMGLFPVVVWWLAYYFARGKKLGINKRPWFTAALAAVVVTVVAMPLLFYFYRGAFGIPMGTPYQSAGTFALIFDMANLLISNLFAQLLGLHLYRRSRGICPNIALSIIATILLIFAILTFIQPNFPLWFDHLNDHFGR